ncbi:RsmB/NOP family class I SAM-dependent RNA methyltransferase [Thermosulfuriphilus ammonigenes]|uniref:RsmB/NOP family class I SAM-dependent RNA methyltransferase n=1 Tax=Thermosulfuriphilus ammonigenes TaxID=1936021 RepID=A0A6G7PX15_9BACT|nr:RsmB/NOP family class I SAM-dependent RNA methyltransferase [Thermosulfuriphilus ammonigenes]MBA2849667.1 NOL1/NOP2/sun family putative RNA methylase [Thermosulfuriphilus ammonigenes]QIJ72235.1 RsmB/NOP family class I SAM-dependent RNA methyltransferase [Thermosulfuriphilus ammonigenes]
MVTTPFEAYRSFIPDFEAFSQSLLEPLPMYIRINRLKCLREERVINGLAQKGVHLRSVTEIPDFYEISPWGFPIGTTEEYYLGYIYPQTINSALPVLALNPQPGETILDLCAAPGSKTSYIAQRTEDRTLIVANDKRIDRLTALVSNLKRLGITGVVTTQYRGEMFPMGPPFDKVLVDAPCSGEGRYRITKEGEVLYRKETRTDLPAIQKGLLLRAFDLVKTGGIVVYSTCTFNPLENEAVVDYLLNRRPAEILKMDYPLPSHPGLKEFNGRVFDSRISHCARFYPHETHSVGFFIATIRRLSGSG